MKQFIGFVKKEFFHIFRDARTMLILFAIPIAQILIFGYVVTNDIKDVRIAILDKSKDDTTKKITNKILSSGYFVLDKNLSSDKEIEEIFKRGKVREVIVYEPNFGKKLEKENTAAIQIITDASNANIANMIANYTSGIIYNYIRELNKSVRIPMRIIPQSRMIFNENLKSVYMFVPGIMALILTLISALMTSVSIAREKEMGTMEVLLVSPLKPVQIIIGKVIPYVVISLVNALTIILLAYFVFELPVNGSVALLMTETMLYIMLALSLGILISTTAKTQQVAMFISVFALMLPTLLLSGFIYPIENMPKILQLLCYVMPAKYFIIIIKNIMIKGTGIMYVWKETAIIIGITLFIIILSVKKFKIRLE